MPCGVNPRPVLAGTIVAVLAAGIAVAVVRPGDLGDGGGLDDAARPTTTAPAGDPAPGPQGTDEPATTAPGGAGAGVAEGTTTTAPADPGAGGGTATTAPSPAPAPAPAGDPERAPTLAHTGGSDELAPLAVALLLAAAVARRAADLCRVEPAR